MINPVEEYLENNKDKKLGIDTLKRELSMKGRSIRYFVSNSEHIRHVEPIEVGSGKEEVSVYTYQ